MNKEKKTEFRDYQSLVFLSGIKQRKLRKTSREKTEGKREQMFSSWFEEDFEDRME